MEVGEAALVPDHKLSVDDGGGAAKPGREVDDRPEARRVEAVAGEAADPTAANDDFAHGSDRA